MGKNNPFSNVDKKYNSGHVIPIYMQSTKKAFPKVSDNIHFSVPPDCL